MGLSAALGASVFSQSLVHPLSLLGEDNVDIAVAEGSNYFENTIKAVNAIGGMGSFVPKDSNVAILPNAQRWNPGTFTKPDIIRAVIQMCKKAGAKEVNCLSWLRLRNWEETGIAAVIEEEEANLVLVEGEETYFKPIPVPKGIALKEAWIMKEFYNNDIFIDIPVTKDHAGNKFTGTMKNLMGLNFGTSNRTFHKKNWTTDQSAIEFLDQCIADLNTVVKPHLCIVDATEFIITNGPMGPGKVIKPQKVVAGLDRVAIDTYCTTLWGLNAEDIVMIRRGFEHGLGSMDLSGVNIKEIKV